MKSEKRFSRRAMIGYSSATAGVIGLSFPSSAAYAKVTNQNDAPGEIVEGIASANGWPVASRVDNGESVWSHQVSGTPLVIEVAVGSATIIFAHLLQRYHYEIDMLREGDAVGFRVADDLSGTEGNHASGSAVDIRPSWYPAGTSGGYSPLDTSSIRSILEDFDGLVRWGGDFGSVDEAHFEISVRPDDKKLERLVRRLRDRKSELGKSGKRLAKSDELAAS